VWYNVMLSIMVSFAVTTLVFYKYGLLIQLGNEEYVVGVPIAMALFWTGVGVIAYRRDET
jgi:hydrogenase-4 membrane subunit HyfE